MIRRWSLMACLCAWALVGCTDPDASGDPAANDSAAGPEGGGADDAVAWPDASPELDVQDPTPDSADAAPPIDVPGDDSSDAADAGDVPDPEDADAGDPGEVIEPPTCGYGELQGMACSPTSDEALSGAVLRWEGTGCDGEPASVETTSAANGLYLLGPIAQGVQTIHIESALFSDTFTTYINAGAVTDETGLATCVPAVDPATCKTGVVLGNLCPHGTSTVGAAGIPVSIDTVDCNGKAVTISSVATPKGDFVLYEVPAGAHILEVESPDFGTTWTSLIVVEGGTSNDFGPLAAISCGGVMPEPSGGSGGGGALGTICTDPKWNLCGEEIIDFCISPEPPFPDCNDDGVPDPCPTCPPIEVVFALDTSGSMGDELSALCNDLTATVEKLSEANIEMKAEVYGIAYGLECSDQTVAGTFGTEIDEAPPSFPGLGGCGGADEDWGHAAAVIAANKEWEEGALRLVITISDEGPGCGDPINEADDKAIYYAALMAEAHDVVVSPITGTGSSPDVIKLAQKLAADTGGQWHATTDPDVDIAGYILFSVLSACSQFSDCNQNAIPDDCDMAIGKLSDLDGDGIPDECED